MIGFSKVHGIQYFASKKDNHIQRRLGAYPSILRKLQNTQIILWSNLNLSCYIKKGVLLSVQCQP